ncbi:hypothetical protein LINGRAHAP2_LOCUS2006 [Linum grandiflorum]
MRQSLLRNFNWRLLHSSRNVGSSITNPSIVPLAAASSRPLRRLYSSESGEKPGPVPESSALAQVRKDDESGQVEDVSNKDLNEMMEKYFKGEEDVLPSIMESILRRRLSGKHEETDDELMEELRMKPLDDVKDDEFESDLEDMHDTDEEIDDLYSASDIVTNRMQKDEYFNMDDKKWDEMVSEAIAHGFMKDTRECENILEDMLNWDKLLPADIKEKVEKKFNELGDLCENGELEPEAAYQLFKEFEDQIVLDYGNRMEAKGAPQFDDTTVPDKKKDTDDPPGEGPILRWTTRAVFAPGGDAWHPKNRKVKMAVTVKELGLSKHQFSRLRELVGKRYHPGKDELTITSERYEHREENRKDCLRTLFSIIEEAGKANKLADDARVSYVKSRLKANPAFMARLRAKVAGRSCNVVNA